TCSERTKRPTRSTRRASFPSNSRQPAGPSSFPRIRSPRIDQVARVDVKNLVKRFGSTVVLGGVDISVPDGAFAVLVGPSGCGKSTLLRSLAGLEQVDGGSIHFGDRDVTHKEPRDRDIAMVFQSYALYPHLTVRENLAFGLKLRKADPAEITRRVTEASEM